MYHNHVWKFQRLPTALVSEGGPPCIATFRLKLCQQLQIQPQLSMSFHPQTDMQTEKAKGGMQQYLRSYVSYQREDWSAFLSLAKFAVKSHVSETTDATPFMPNHGPHPHMNYATPMNELHNYLNAKICYTEEKQKQHTNLSRTPTPHGIRK